MILLCALWKISVMSWQWRLHSNFVDFTMCWVASFHQWMGWDLQIESLVQRVSAGGIKEVILALSTTMEGDTTNFYIYRKLEKLGVKLSVIARGISVGDELEYADEVTLGRSIVNRTPFSGTN